MVEVPSSTRPKRSIIPALNRIASDEGGLARPSVGDDTQIAKFARVVLSHCLAPLKMSYPLVASTSLLFVQWGMTLNLPTFPSIRLCLFDLPTRDQRLRSYSILSPFRVRNSSTSSIVLDSGAIRAANPPVAITLNLSLASERILLHNSVHQADIAEKNAGLHGVDGVFGNDVRRLGDVDAR